MKFRAITAALVASSCIYLSGCSVTLQEKEGASALSQGQNAEQALRYEEAAKFYQKAAASHNQRVRAQAQYELAGLYNSGNGVPLNRSQAIALLTQASLAQHESATLALAAAYAEGNGILKNTAKAEALLQPLVTTNPAAALAYVRLHQQNQTPTITTNAALSTEERALLDDAILALGSQSFNHNDDAALTLAREFRDGKTIEQNDEKAQTWYRYAIKLGNITAAQELANFWLENPEKFAERQANAIQLLEQAAKLGNISAMVDIADAMNTPSSKLYNPTKAITWYEKATQAGSLSAMTSLGRIYLASNNKTLTYKGLSLLEKASAHEYGSASLELGRYYRDGRDGKPNFIKAITYFQLAKNQGNPNADADIALAYLKGQGVGINKTKAKALLEQAASQKVTSAMLTLADMLQDEHKGKNSTSSIRALSLYEQAAAAGLMSAHKRLGDAYAEGMITTRNDTKAFKHHMIAAQAGNVGAIEHVADAYQNARGIGKSSKSAFEWNLKAAKADSAKAMLEVALAYDSGNGVAKNRVEADTWLRRAVKLKPESVMSVAGAYEKGNGVPKMPQKAIMLYEQAAKAGQVKAMHKLADTYNKGEIVPINPQKAFEWTQKAAAKGDIEAQATLAKSYMNGTGTAQNTDKSLETYKKLAASGNTDAMRALASAYSVGVGVEQNLATATQWYEKAANKGDAESQYQLGLAYARGLGVQESKDKARMWLEKASKNGYSAAAAILETLTTPAPTATVPAPITESKPAN